MKKLLPFLALCIFMLSSFMMQSQRNCGVIESHERLIQEHPEMIQNMERIEMQTRNFLQNQDQIQARVVITIPVVVHVVYKTNAQNISDAQIQSQIDVLNEDFRRTNSDANNVWSQGDDVMIEFCLASVDPNGNATNGIERRKTNKPSFGTNDQMKFNSSGGLDAWPADDYLNIWSCNINQYLGYAQFPGGPDATDGVVVDYAYFGRGGSALAPFDLGRTATHEVGHWLNLRHIWGDGGCGVDDFVNDTPLSDAPNYGCAIGHVSCSTTDMVQNYMDYSDDACMNLFTTGQGGRMNALFGNGGVRASLLNSNGCGGATGPTCSDGIMNGDETGIDCGGSICAPCSGGPTCTDGMMNGNETGVDCGGPDCGPCSGGTCIAPTPTGASSIKNKTAKLNWNAASGAVSYSVRYRVAGSNGSWSNKTTSSTQVTATGLNNNQTYEWQVKSICNGSESDYSDLCTFTAGDANSSSCGASSRFFEGQVKLMPNPATTQINIIWSNLDVEQAEMIIYNSMGQTIKNISIESNAGNIEMDVSDWTKGIYLVRIYSKDGQNSIQKLIVQ